MKFTQIDPGIIDLQKDLFRTSLDISSEELKHSIQAVGLLNPPILSVRRNRPEIVSGWKRITACLELGLCPIPVFIARDRSNLRLFQLAVYENASARGFSPVEKAEVLAKLKAFGAADADIIRRFLPLLKIPPTAEYLELFLTLARYGPEEKRIVHEKGLSITVLKALNPFSREERALLWPLLRPLGRNKQKELLVLLQEIARREHIQALSLLREPGVTALKDDDTLSALQKAERMVDLLRERRNPAFSAWSRAFEAVLKRLKIDKGILVVHSPYFEDEDLSLRFTFKDREEFLARLSSLKILAEKPEFDRLFSSSEDD